jgi:hypothetical protein
MANQRSKEGGFLAATTFNLSFALELASNVLVEVVAVAGLW